MKLCQFKLSDNQRRIGLVEDDETVLDLTSAGIRRFDQILDSAHPVDLLEKMDFCDLPRHPLKSIALLPPVQRQEIWAAGVTYEMSKAARMEESNFSAQAYRQVYTASRPELFFKCLPDKVVGPGEAVGVRKDSGWTVPEPELALVLNAAGTIVGCTIGNDMSSRDIEGENLLYLSQAKIYDRSCALGPWIVIGASEREARDWDISMTIKRQDDVCFTGCASTNLIKRPFAGLTEYLFRSQTFPHGVILLTGTGVIPEDAFTLYQEDEIEIEISGIGKLNNPVRFV